jgi:hypothetical protein
VPTLDQATRARLSEIRDIARSGVTELTGRAIREGGEGAIVGRIGGLKPMYPELLTIPDSPKQIAIAIDKGKGRAFERVYAAVEAEMERAGFQPGRARSPGRPSIPPHAGKPYCYLCRQHHTKGQHRAHGAGSFHRTHLWAFSLGNPDPMTRDVARQIFAALMAKAREGRLTDKERAQLRTASQIIRYEKRRGFTGAVNRPRKQRRRLYPMTTKKAATILYHLGQRHALEGLPRDPDLEKSRPYLKGYSLVPVTITSGHFRNPRGEGRISRSKARLILHEGEIRGFPLTKKQRGFFGARASGYPRRRAQFNRGRRGLLRMGKLVELRYYRDHGKKPGYYKHTFDGSPTLYYDAARNTILAR